MTDYNSFKLHAILYAKGHYDYDKTLKGLRVIAGHYAGMDVEYITDEHLMHFMLMMVEEYVPNLKFSDVILDIFRESWKWRSDKTLIDMPKNGGSISQLDVVEGLMSRLRYITVDKLPTLPEADSSIYPLRQK